MLHSVYMENTEAMQSNVEKQYLGGRLNMYFLLAFYTYVSIIHSLPR